MKDNFSKQADLYSKFRPGYPKKLFDFLLPFVPDKKNAWDCGTGNGQVAAKLSHVRAAFNTMRLIVTFGWAIYPIGYFVGHLTGASPADSAKALNIIYNAADVLNKIAFGLIIWSVAVSESEQVAMR